MKREKTPETVEKRYTATIENAAAEGYDATGVLSASKEDRVYDTIDVAAYQPWVGKRIPALFGHDHEKIIGTWENLRVQGEQLIGDLRLAGTNLGKMISELIKANVPLMNSIGFRGTGKPREGGKGFHFQKLDLLEASVVAVGAHPDARMIAKSFGVDLPPENPDPSPAESSTSPRDEVTKRAAAALRTSLTVLHKDSANETL